MIYCPSHNKYGGNWCTLKTIALAKIFPDVEFEESESELDHAGDIDYIGKVGEKFLWNSNKTCHCKCQLYKKVKFRTG